MSASLVGSEMCIRDSDCQGRDLQRPVHALREQPRRPRVRDRLRPGLPEAVSYTHLTLADDM
eukprot:10244838-Alexandrium_andersonii.AAC.1